MSVKQSTTKRNPAKLNEWNLRTSGFNVKFKSSLYVNGNYLLGYSNQVIHSTDSITWTARTTGSLNAGTFPDESAKVLRYYDNKYFLIHAGNELLVSTDTIVWQIRTALTEYAGIVKDDAGLFHVVGSVNNPQIAFSTDTITWTLRTSGVSLDGHYAYGNGIHMLATTQGLPVGGVNISTDGVVWENSSNQIFALINGNKNLEYANGIFRLTKAFGYRSYTTDGIVWFPSEGGSTRFGSPPPSVQADGLSFNAGTWIMVGNNGIIETSNSNDDLSWIIRTSNTSTSLKTVASADGSFLVAGESGVVLINTNELEKTTTTRPGLVFYNDRISGIVTVVDGGDVASKSYVDKTLIYPDIAPQDEGKFLTTTDGIANTWDYVSNIEEFTTPGAQSFTVPNQANLLYIEAVGAGAGGGAGKTFADGLVWISRTLGVNAGMRSIVYGNNLYLTGGRNGGNNGPLLYASTDTIVWVARTSGTGNPLHRVHYGGGLFFHNNLGNQLYSSTDSIVWTARTVGFTNSIYAFVYNNLYVVGANGGTLSTSTDTIVWTPRTSGFGSTAILSLIYSNNLYVAGGDRGVLTTSTDSIIWTRRTSGFGLNGILSLTYGNNLYVAGGQSGTLTTSTDTIVWEQRTSRFGITTINGLTYGNGLYVAGSQSGTLTTSTDAIAWTYRTSQLTGIINSILYDRNIFITATELSQSVSVNYASNSGKGGSAGAYTSWYIPKNILGTTLTVTPGTGGTGGTTDGELGSAGSDTTISWTGPNAQTYTITAPSTAANTVSSSSSFYTTAGSDGAIVQYISSSSGNDGTSQTEKFQPTGGGSGAVDSGIGGSGGSISYYGNSISVSGGIGADTATLTGQNATAISGLPYGGGGGGGSISAGYSWTLRTSGKSLNASFYSSVIGNGYYILGSQGFILSSTDTIVWEQQDEGGNFNIYGLTKSPEFFLAAGGPNGYVSTSTNAVVWILRTSGFTDIVRQAIYGDNQFIISGDNAFLAVSTNAIHWTKRTTGVSITEPIEGLGYANGYYFIGYPNATPSVSTDTITWIKRTAPVDSYKSFGYQNGYYVMTDGGGADVISSTDTVIWISRTTGNISGGIGNNNLGVTPTGFIIQGRNAGNTDQWYSISTDSITWTVRASNSSVIKSVRSITYGDGYALVGGSDGFVEVSPVYIGSGGNGVRGGGGGGGAVYSTSFGNGGNGGDGYVKITWW